ncbi:unnamed protein product [Closterium sp. Naga37s-1]|nr:unnamed protein product [Closterium sp. Naga37s-1]
MDGGVLSKAGAMAAIAESEVFESGDEDEESRVLWQIMMIEEAAREAAARQRTTPNSDTVTPVSTSAGAAPHKDAARAANSGGTISKSTSTGALSSLISARSFRIRGKSSASGLPFLPALTVPESDTASADHGPLSCSALPSAAAAAPSGSIAPPLTPSRRFSKWFSFRAADKAQASSGDSNAAAAKSSAQFLSGKTAIGGFSSAAVSDSSEVVSLSVAEPIAECESEEGRGSTEGRSAAEETSKPKDTSGAVGLVSPK